MSRWHKASCHTPKVHVEDGQPRCQSCGTSPDIQKLISEQAAQSPPWAVPPDEKFGEMKLSWPDAVRYTPTPADIAKGDVAAVKEPGALSAPSPIYTRRLGTNEFRLLYLSAVGDDSHPIHADLEAYHTDDRPEYETVSYCWGGENGDTRLYKPIFLGIYWDILLQTSNCWSMLHYLRPRVGVRIIWVDAICINQKDYQERESQVTMMGDIYAGCLRAIVFLGEDIVRSKSTNTRKYPERRELDETSAASVNLQQVLTARYFQRVWVIQELIRAPMVVIPVHGKELTAGRHTGSSSGMAWQKSSAPWLSNICAGQSDTTLKAILEQTRNSQATDPRDKIFGLLGFLPRAQGLRPNYSLSALHIYVGAIAYMLLNEGHFHILAEAAGYEASPMKPSWLPEGNLSTIGSLLQRLSSAVSRSSGNRKDRERLLSLNPDWESLLTVDGEETTFPPPRYGAIKLLPTTPVNKALEFWLPSPGKPSIHPLTAALSIPLIFLWESSLKPIEVHRLRGPPYIFQMTVAYSTLYIFTRDASLGSVIGQTQTRVFLFKTKLGQPLLLFMRRVPLHGHYRLLKCCACADILISRKSSSKPRLHGEDEDDIVVPYMRPRISSQRLQSILSQTVYDIVCRMSWITGSRRRKIDHSDISTIESRIRHLFHELCLNPTACSVDNYAKILQQYRPNCLVMKLEEVSQTWIYVSMNPRDWEEIHQYLDYDWYEKLFPQFGWKVEENDDEGPWYWVQAPRPTKSFSSGARDLRTGSAPHLTSWTVRDYGRGRYRADGWRESSSVTMAAKVEDFNEWLRRNRYFEHFRNLRVCSQLTGEDILTLATTEPKPEYRSICFYDWPASFFNGKDIPGKQEMVTIC